MLWRVLKFWAALANRGGDGMPQVEGEPKLGELGGSQVREGLNCQAAKSRLDSLGPGEPWKFIGLRCDDLMRPVVYKSASQTLAHGSPWHLVQM